MERGSLINPFSRTLRSLERDGYGGGAAALALGALLLGAWGLWFVEAEVTVHEVSRANLEATNSTWWVEAPVGGRVLSSTLSLDRSVEAGAVLVELDAMTERLRLKEARASRAALGAQIAALEEEIGHEREGIEGLYKADEARLGQAQALARGAAVDATLRGDEAERMRQLHAQGHASDQDMERSAALASQGKEEATAQRLSAAQVQWSRRSQESERRANLARLERALAELEGELRALDSTLEGLEHEIALRQLRSPARGSLAAVTPLREGSMVTRDQRVASVISEGPLRLVARMAPQAALGRVTPGQRARLRLDAYPWTQYGAIEARVDVVDAELKDGAVRVELRLGPAPRRVWLRHGLTGEVEIDVEVMTPAELVLRTLGRALTQASEADGG